MKNTPPKPVSLPSGYLCTTHLIASLHRLCAIIAGQCLVDNVLTLSRLAAQTVRVIIKAETHNGRLSLKRTMLSAPHWRERVMSDLGGEAALSKWEARVKTAARRAVLGNAQEAQSRLSQNELERQRVKLEKLAEVARIRAAHRAANAHANVCFDRVKTDFNGEFRLAPIPRRARGVKARDDRAASAAGFKSAPQFNSTMAQPIALLPSELRARGPRQSPHSHETPPNSSPPLQRPSQISPAKPCFTPP